jgi:hypothetical protein
MEGCFDSRPDRSFFLYVRQFAMRYEPIFKAMNGPGQMKDSHNIFRFSHQLPRARAKKAARNPRVST